MRFGPGVALVAAVASIGAVSCESCQGGGGGGGGTSAGGAWLVGEQGLMLNPDPETARVRRYPLETRADLFDIACRDAREAWVVGDGGLLLATGDGGATWRPAATGAARALRSIAVAHHGSRAFAAGDGGTFLISEDDGRSWRAVEDPDLASGADLAAVATTDGGDLALITATDGTIRRWTAARGGSRGALERLRSGAGTALWGVALSADGARAAAVGAAGLALASEDGGSTWRPLDAGTKRTLRDVWLAEGGRRVVAVGEAGVVVDGAWGGKARARELFGDEGSTLRGVHLGADGRGALVGDGGSLLVTDDGGATWSWFVLGEARRINAADSLRLGGHL